MHKNYLGATLAAIFAVAPLVAWADAIDVTAGAPGQLTPSDSATTVLTFDNLAVGALPSYIFVGGSLSGAGAVEDTTSADFAMPYDDDSNFLAVAGTDVDGSTTLDLTAPENYFGLYWGSLDPYNSISFLMNGQEVASYTGADIASLLGLDDSGDQQSTASNRYVNFYLNGDFYDEVVLSTTGYGFEVDNIAFGDPAVVPEPATLPVLGFALAALALVRRPRHLISGVA